MTEPELIPVTLAELEMQIEIQIAAMRARKESGWIKDNNPTFAKALAARLVRANLKIFRGPPVPFHSTRTLQGGT